MIYLNADYLSFPPQRTFVRARLKIFASDAKFAEPKGPRRYVTDGLEFFLGG